MTTTMSLISIESLTAWYSIAQLELVLAMLELS
jgi:hypothetical protein